MGSVVTKRFIKCHDKLKEDNRVRSSRQFALSLDYLPQGLSEIIKGRREVSTELLRRAVEKYKINPVYILTGSGPMFMTDEEQKNIKVLTIVTNPQDEEQIVHVPAQAMPVYAGAVDNPNFIQALTTFTLPGYRYKANCHRCFEVFDDSMEHSLFEGEKIICSFIQPNFWHTSLKANYVYVFVKHNEILIRRIANLAAESNKLELQCDNTFYSQEEISFADIREIWLVKSKLGPYLPTASAPKQRLNDDIKELRQIINQQSKAIHSLQQLLEDLIYQQKEGV